MKKYLVLAVSITGIRGKQLLQGETHEAGEFMEDHILAMIEGGFISEVAEAQVLPIAETPTIKGEGDDEE